MKIALDYGGVISFSPDGWAESISRAQSYGHEFFILSHARPGKDLQLRTDFALRVGARDLSFAHLHSGSQEKEIAQYKADLCLVHDIEIFIDDDINRVEAVARHCPRCASFYIPQSLWQIGQHIIHDLREDW